MSDVDNFVCEVCGGPIKTGIRITVHNLSGEHEMHFVCHEQWNRERGIHIDHIEVYSEGQDA